MNMKLGSERGVAMMTVLFVGAAMTAVTSMAALATIRDFRAGTDDRKATEALAYAEAGIDRLMHHIRGGSVSWGQLRKAGCPTPLKVPEGAVGRGSFDTYLTVVDPFATTSAGRFPPVACATVPATPKEPLYLAVVSTGTHPKAIRVVQQVLKVEDIDLPIGLSAENVDANGTPSTTNISMITDGEIMGRKQLNFAGFDPYYTLGDFWPGHTWTNGLTAGSPLPAGAHSVNGIYLNNNGKDPEFTGAAPKNCTANKESGNTQSLWDSDGRGGVHSGGCPGQVGWPPDSLFTPADYEAIAPGRLGTEDHEILKDAAKSAGLYCYIPASGAYCIRQGSQVAYTTDVAPIVASGTQSFVAYFEFPSGDPLSNNVSWASDVWNPPSGCNPDPDLNKSVVVIVKNGGLNFAGNNQVNGAFILDGNFDYTGTPRINGTVIAENFRVRGNATFTLDTCWVQNMPGPFLGATPVQWSEIDR
ncbi:MAG: pilus assembly PilX N-terminal domain-containing protein [Actinomycetota bacterium]|nr:pilus assembly PilX N-terminal domain-containing protein [Actinomycetota bacterium]